MSDLNILIVEGNIREDSEFFIKAAGASAADNLKNLILKLEPLTNTEIINPGHDDETKNALENMDKFNGIVFTGGAILTWWTIPLMLGVGFLTPWPYNYWRLKKFGINCH